MLVEAGRHADRVGKIEAEDPHRKPRIVRRRRTARHQPQPPYRQPMGILGVKETQQWPGQALEQADHGASSGNTCRPSVPKGSGTAHSTAWSDSGP